MKINMPVTGVEQGFSEGDVLITTTNLKGSITYYNNHFKRISGFNDDELTGKNHNMVRHPDMPPAAFGDLWSTIQSGKSWMGVVKNRAKNGDHYYVDAYVTPISKSGKSVEYQSVRIPAKKEFIDRAETLYKRIRENKPPISIWHKTGMTLRLMLAFASILIAALGFSLLPGNPSIPQLVVALLTGLGISYGLARLITKPLQEIVKQTRQTIDNPLARQVYGGSQSELAQIKLALHMKDLEINSIVARLLDTSDQWSRIVEETSCATKETSEGVARQHSEIDQLATAMNEVASTVQEVARNTGEAAQAAQDADQTVATGKQDVATTIESISQVAEGVRQASEVVSRLKEESTNIGSVLDVIRGIAEQTNLLALNAAIEAARAGEQGRGFAVVADEVRSLAKRTQESTQEIQSMIESIQSGASEAVSAMESGREQVEGSVTRAQKAGDSLDHIAEIVTTISNMNIQIASATEEQSSVSEEMNRNVVNINSAADSNAANSQQTSIAVGKLEKFTEHLTTLVRQFQK
ncbi:MAG TPA: PAS domain S-box protein [Gammaproteobacteria bacterium]|nr:PAS domain S-box protein [Gammaproteobacteria bacterium]